VRRNDLAGMTISTNFPGGLFGKNWDVDEVSLQEIDTDRDTVGEWLKDYEDALKLMGGRGVALGTDMNGFAPQIPSASTAVNYPITVAAMMWPALAISTTKGLTLTQPARLGNRVFDFQKDGLAHYGMLPDFMQALY